VTTKEKLKKGWKVRTIKDPPFKPDNVDMKVAERTLREMIREREDRSRKSRAK